MSRIIFLGLVFLLGAMGRPEGNGHEGNDRVRGLSCLFSCVMPGRSLGHSQAKSFKEL